MWDFITDSGVGSVASVLGLLVAIIGFTLTLWNVSRSRTAAEEARNAASKVQRNFLKFGAVEDIASAITTMEEIKRLQRHRAWAVLPERYQALRKHLISIKGSFPGLTGAQSIAIQSAIQQFSGIESALESPPSATDEEKVVVKLNRIVSSELDSLQAVLVEMRSTREE